jgi:hypothetical protein
MAVRSYVCTLCLGSGFVMAAARNAEQLGAPYAFRCQCGEGRAKAQTGIPLWSKKHEAGFEVLAAIQVPEDAVKPEVSATPLNAPASPEVDEEAALTPPVQGLTAEALVTLSECVDAARAGQPLKSQPRVAALIQKFGKESVLAAVRSIRLQDSTPRVVSRT